MGSMNLTDIKELYRNTADYIDQEVMVGGWVGVSEILRHSDSLF